MNYTVSLLTTRPDCQALIDIATTEKSDLNYRKTGLMRQSQNATLTSAEIEAALTSVSAELTALQTLIDNLPDGPIKEDTIRSKYGVLSILEREYDLRERW